MTLSLFNLEAWEGLRKGVNESFVVLETEKQYEWEITYIYTHIRIYFIYIKHIYDIFSLEKKFIQSLLNEQHCCLIGSLLQLFLIIYLLPTLRVVL